jgi:hypothetical protein
MKPEGSLPHLQEPARKETYDKRAGQHIPTNLEF